jgi:hypothetical protein
MMYRKKAKVRNYSKERLLSSLLPFGNNRREQTEGGLTSLRYKIVPLSRHLGVVDQLKHVDAGTTYVRQTDANE